MNIESGTYELHHILNGKDSVVGTLEVKGDKIVYPSVADEHNCDIFAAGEMDGHTLRKFKELLNNPYKSMYVTKV